MRLLPKILLAVVVPVTVGTGAVLLVLSGSWQRTLESELVESARRSLVTRVDTVPAGLQVARESLRLLAGTPVLAGDDLAATRAALGEWARQNSQFENFYFVKPGGLAYPAVGEPFSVHDRDYFPAFLRGDEVMGQAQVSPLTQQPVLLLLVPVLDAAGRLVGGLGGSVALGALFERTVAAGGPLRTDQFMLFDQSGRLLAGRLDGSPPPMQVPTPARGPHTAAVAEAVFQALAAEEMRLDLRVPVGGEMLRVLHAPVPAVSWRLVYVQPESLLLAPLADARRLAGVVVVAASLAALALAALLYRLIVRPVRHLTEVQGRLRRGERTARARVDGGDELAELASSFNLMADSLQATEMRFRAVFEAAPYAVTVSRLDGGALLDVNPAFERQIGYTRGEAVGRNTVQLGIAADPEALRADTARLRSSGRLDNVEMHGIDRQGKPFWALYSSRLIDLGGERLIVTMSADITPQKVAEQARRESEESFSSLFEMAPIPLSVVDEVDGFHRTHWNEAWYQAFGYSRAEAENRSGNDFGLWAHPADREAYIAAATGAGDVSPREVPMRRRDGSLRQVEVFGRMIRSTGRQQLMTVYVDVSDARRAEAELRAREMRLRSLFEVSPVAILILDLAGRIREVNQRFPEMLQRPLDEVLGHSYFEFVAPAELDAAHQGVGRMLEDARMQVFSCERSYLRRDGSTLSGFLSARRMPGDDDHDVLLVVISDLSELRRAEALRLASESKLQAVFNASPAAMIVSDVALNYASVAANEAWERQFQRSREQVMGLTGAEMGLWASADDRRHVLATIERDGSISDFETMLVRGDGVELRCRIAARKVRAGDAELLVMVQEDVTELRRAETALREMNEALDARVRVRTEELARINEELSGTLEALRCTQGDLVRSEKLAALGALVAGVAHELNTPIGNSVTVASTLVEQSEHFVAEMQAGLRRSVLLSYVDSSRRAAELLLANLQRAANLVTGFKQVAVDQTSEQRRSFEVSEVVDEILAMLNPQLKKRPLDIRETIPAGLRLDSYPGPFGQVVANLINNAAVHAFDDGRRYGTIRIEAGRGQADGVRLSISDDGIGIPPEHLDRIFDPFFTTRLGKGGSGLGLHIVYNIVTGILGGSIHVASEPGRGTRFTIELPRTAPLREESPAAG
ncbi:MAG TPA: PAS domain S-box protein [Azospira sp.]|nr:PAS domain S-box protein [Azospira sp.]